MSRAELISSRKGVKGGYLLARHPDEITLWDVIQALDAHPHLVECVDRYFDVDLPACLDENRVGNGPAGP